MDILDPSSCPTLNDIQQLVDDPLLNELLQFIQDTYRPKIVIEYSKCSLAKGWNIKFKKSSRNLCTIYPKEKQFALQIVIGPKEKETMPFLLPTLSSKTQKLYQNTAENNNQRWLFFQAITTDTLKDIQQLLAVRSGKEMP